MQQPAPAAWESVGEVHRLVQLIAREQQSEEVRQASLAGLLAGLDAHMPFDSDDVRIWPVCALHVTAAIRYADDAAIDIPRTPLMMLFLTMLKTHCMFITDTNTLRKTYPKWQAALDILMENLGPRERMLLELRLGLTRNGVHSLKQIGYLLRISKEEVRVIQNRALEKLHSSAERVGWDSFLLLGIWDAG